MSERILIIEDIAEMSELIRLYIENAGMQAETCETAELALKRLETCTPDLVLLDLNLPGMSGLDFLNKLKTGDKKSVPVMIVSARDADEDIIAGLGYGADEFVTKPFSPRVLVARVQANLRKNLPSSAGGEQKFRFGEYTVLLESCVVKKGDKKIPLSAKEYEVLEFLIKNEGATLAPEKIYSSVWQNQYGDMTAVAVYMQRLRKKFEADPAHPQFLRTVFGMGYKFVSGNSQ